MLKQAQFVLFLDPQTFQFFSYCEEKGIIIKEFPPETLDKLIQQDAHSLKQLFKQIPYQWKSLTNFQKRPIPINFLTPRKFRYPIYTTQEIIHESMLQLIKFNESGGLLKGEYKETIKARVYLGSIKSQIMEAKKNFPEMNTEFIDEVQIKLIASVNEVIRIVCRYILTDYKIVITTTSPHSKLIFKCVNKQEYLYGNEPFGNYDCVRECLREEKKLEIEVLESDITKEKQQFEKFIFQRSVERMEKGYYEPFPWNSLILKDHCGFFMWYRPDTDFIDPSFYLKKEVEKSSKELERLNYKIKMKLEIRKRQKEKKIPRFLLKENIHIFLQKRREALEKKLVSIEGTTIYSGECCFLFSFDIFAVHNLITLLQAKNQAEKGEKKEEKTEMKASRKPLPKFSSHKELNDELSTFSTSIKRYNQFAAMKKNEVFPIIPYQVSVVGQFYYNSQPFSNPFESPLIIADNTVFFKHKVQFEESLSDLMLETSLVFKLKLYSKQGQSLIFGVGVLKLFDEFGFLKQGEQTIQLLPHENINPLKLGCYSQSYEEVEKKSYLKVVMPKFRQPVRWTLRDHLSLKVLGFLPTEENEKKMNYENQMDDVQKLIEMDPLRIMNYTKEEKQILRSCKKYYKNQSSKLINYLYSINWKNIFQVAEVYKSLQEWAPLKPLQALFILNPRISDEKVRYFAVKALEKMNNSDFCLYASQITQALVSFQTHENPLFDLIIERSCIDPFMTGQQYFWQFKNRLTEQITSYRFCMYMQTFIFTCPIRRDFEKQVRVNRQLVKINSELIEKTEHLKKFEEKNEKFQSKVSQIEERLLQIHRDTYYDETFSFPIRPQNQFRKIIIEQSSMFDSKKLPFALACSPEKYNSKNKQPYRVMFKAGDDIKQDFLILQLFKIFDNLWKEVGYDFKMNIYRVLSTGDQIGFLELVNNASNSSKVHGETGKGIKALDEEATKKFLEIHNKEKEDFRKARENYLRSNAGYLVATYVLGIGDRHSGNYMIQKNGKFFHIDFGHILGDFKTKFNIKRQRTPFVFTSEHAFVMGGQKSKDFARFELYCCNAYNVLRKHSKTIINLLVMMVGAEIPQLRSYQPISYAIEKLHLQMSDHQASEHLIQEIRKTLQNETRKYDNVFHQMVRAG